MEDDPLGRLVNEIQETIDREERTLYSDTVRNEAGNPHGMRRMEDFDGKAVYTGPCGDTMEIFLRIRNSTILESSFLTDGCGPTVAAGSMLMKMIEGMKISDALQMTDDDLVKALDGLPQEHLHCATLAITALYKAIDDLYNRGVL